MIETTLLIALFAILVSIIPTFVWYQIYRHPKTNPADSRFLIIIEQVAEQREIIDDLQHEVATLNSKISLLTSKQFQGMYVE